MDAMSRLPHDLIFAVLGFCMLSLLAQRAPAQASSQLLVPGTGEKLTQVGDDLEDTTWSYRPNGAKSSKNIDENIRQPTGTSVNGRWFEGALRGQPDVVQRVPTPENGIPGSLGALLMRSRDTGVPG